jgi:hypothetical protein
LSEEGEVDEGFAVPVDGGLHDVLVGEGVSDDGDVVHDGGGVGASDDAFVVFGFFCAVAGEDFSHSLVFDDGLAGVGDGEELEDSFALLDGVAELVFSFGSDYVGDSLEYFGVAE